MAEKTNIELHCFGGLRFSQNDTVIDRFYSNKAQALLCYLVLTRQAHFRPHLAGLLWSELMEARALSNLRKALYNLRQLAGNHLVITRQNAGVDVSAPCWIDVAVLESTVQQFKGSRRLTSAQAHDLKKAIDLYTGDFLKGFYLRDAPLFDEWVAVQRARLRESAQQGLHCLGVHYAESGEIDDAILYTNRLLTLEPWQEAAHRRLMLLLLQNGRRGAALAQYEKCRQLLQTEFAVAPTPETENLYKQIKNDAVAVQKITRPRKQTAQSVPHNLPAQTTPFIGRKVELTRLNKLLNNLNVRLITLTGVGGMGKTRMALALAHKVAAEDFRFKDGVFFVPLAAIKSSGAFISATAAALNFPLNGNDITRPIEQQVTDFLRRKELLLVLDNYEQLLPITEPLIAFLKAAPKLKILVTSREKLQLREEHSFPLSGLNYPDRKGRNRQVTENQSHETFAAFTLFEVAAIRNQPDFKVREEDFGTLTQICELVEGMPLAIELATSWLDVLSLEAILTELKQNVRILETKSRNVPIRHRHIFAAFESAWGRLTEQEQAVFAGLSIFRSGFSREAAHQVCAPDMSQVSFWRMLSTLIGKSLLRYQSEKERYDLHELVRQYGQEKLVKDEEIEQIVRNRYCAFYCRLLHDNEKVWTGEYPLEALVAVTVEQENVLSAWRQAVEQKHVHHISQMLDSLCHFMEWQGREREGVEICRQAQEILSLSPQNDQAEVVRVHCQALFWEVSFTALSVKYEHARSQLQEAQMLLDGLDLADDYFIHEYAQLNYLWGRVHVVANKTTEAIDYFNRSLAHYEKLRDDHGVATVLRELGMVVSQFQGAFVESRQFFRRALSLFKSTGNDRGMAQVMGSLGLMEKLTNEQNKSQNHILDAIGLARKLKNLPEVAAYLRTLAFTYWWGGEYQKSVAVARDSRVIFLDLGVNVLNEDIESASLLHLGAYDEASILSEQVVLNGVKMREGIHKPYMQMTLGEVALIQGEFERAHQLLEQSRRSDIQSGREFMSGRTLASLAMAARALGSPRKAIKYVITALELALKPPFIEMQTYVPLLAASLLLADKGAHEQAVAVYTLTQRNGHVANSRFYADLVGRHLEALMVALPPEMVVVARERGRGLDLWEAVASVLNLLSVRAV